MGEEPGEGCGGETASVIRNKNPEQVKWDWALITETSCTGFVTVRKYGEMNRYMQLKHYTLTALPSSVYQCSIYDMKNEKLGVLPSLVSNSWSCQRSFHWRQSCGLPRPPHPTCSRPHSPQHPSSTSGDSPVFSSRPYFPPPSSLERNPGGSPLPWQPFHLQVIQWRGFWMEKSLCAKSLHL